MKEKTKTKSGAKERKANWRETYATVEDIQRFLEDRVVLRFNVVTRRVEYRIPSGWREEGGGWTEITDRLLNSLWSEMMQQKPVRVQDMQRVIESDFVPEYNPFRFYLENLPRWDGKSDFLLELSASVLVKGDVEEQLLFARYLKKCLSSPSMPNSLFAAILVSIYAAKL